MTNLNTRSIGNDKSRVRPTYLYFAFVLFEIVVSYLQIRESTHSILRCILVCCGQSIFPLQQDTIFVLIIVKDSAKIRRLSVKLGPIKIFCSTFP